MSRTPGIILVALLVSPFARAADIVAYRASGTYGNVGYEATVLWGQGEYILEMWSRLGTASPNLAKNRQTAEAALGERLEAVFLQSVVALPLDSRETVGSRIAAVPSLLPALKRLVGSAAKRRSHLEPEMEDLRLRWALPLYGEQGLLTLFAPGGKPSPFERYLGFVPAAVYTGLVIYVQGSYPAWGRQGETASLKPCLFARIFDNDMNRVLDATQADRARLAGWGLVAYSNDLDEAPFLDRVGPSPLRIIARGVFGTGNTDIVISREAARLLLARDENMRLLGEGRVLVILDAEAAPEPATAAGVEEGPLEEIAPERETGGLRILAPAGRR